MIIKVKKKVQFKKWLQLNVEDINRHDYNQRLTKESDFGIE